MFQIKDLIEDEAYEFQIVAENEAGCSKPSETTGTITARDPYSRPGKPGTFGLGSGLSVYLSFSVRGFWFLCLEPLYLYPYSLPGLILVCLYVISTHK